MISFSLYSQVLKENILVLKTIEEKKLTFSKEYDFNKACFFYLNEELDSTLIYSAKQLNNSRFDNKLKDWCFFLRGRCFERKKLFKQAKEEFLKIDTNFSLYNHVLANLGAIAIEQKEFEKAILYLKDEKIGQDYVKVKVSKSTIEYNLALSYFYLRKFNKAEFVFLDLIDKVEKERDSFKLISIYSDLANVYYEQYKDDLAIPYFIKAYNLSQKVDGFKLKQNTALNMAVVEENRKDLTKALKYRKEYEQWKDSLNNQNKIWEVAQLEKEYAVNQKQQEVNVLQAENKAKVAQRNGFIYTAIALLLLLSTIAFFYRKNIRAKKIIENQNEKLDALNATKDKLFSIVSHDLRSSVNTLKLSNKKLISNLEKENILEVHHLLKQNSAIVGSAYNLLDNLLNWALLQTKQSYFEIKEIQLFYAVEHVVYNYLPLLKEKELDFESTILKSAKVLADQESLKIILRNLLDNAIKFSKPGGIIKIYIQNSKKDFLDLVVEDTGIGMHEKTVLQLNKERLTVSEKENKEIVGSGLGLQLCKSMIQKNKGKLNIESTLGKGTKMIVSLRKRLPKNE